ncbi:protein of unknown function [Nitrospira japonica]|uniref:Uncharacterized protein n=1 Tax=Nitrospira japonica TaxID=1325564 RepID=A0A1W1I1S0_9BACT|nr:hypothetical protein [Nitrospira japonica]SLM46956.1 protein of unknown function [Nitrospira japonica]
MALPVLREAMHVYRLTVIKASVGSFPSVTLMIVAAFVLATMLPATA